MATEQKEKRIVEIAPGCFNIRAPFTVLGGLLDAGTHMTMIKLKTGRFIALSTVNLDANLKLEVDALTNNGELIDAIIGTNPFHTLAFQGWFAAYPNAKFYGTPRHLRNYPSIKWAGSIGDESIRKLWEPEVFMRIPAGCEFDNPQPESTNHFNGIVAFHTASRTVICDDAFSVTNKPGFIKGTLLGLRDHEISFHFSLYHQALYKTAEAPKDFYDWVLALIADWDFDNMATAHGGYMIGDAKKELTLGLEKARKSLSDLAVAHGGTPF